MKFLSRLLKDDEELTRKMRSGVEEEKQVEGQVGVCRYSTLLEQEGFPESQWRPSGLESIWIS